jgi:hypothetical protein
MSQIDEDDWSGTEFEDWERQEEERALAPDGIADQNDGLLRRYLSFRHAADKVAAVWRDRADVAAVALIGSVAVMPWKEVPRFRPYRRAEIRLWHECKDVDLAVWLVHLRDLNGLRRAKDRALRELHEESGVGVAPHQMDVFILEPGTDRYLGRLCQYNRCPKGKAECLVPGCGATKFLRQHAGFNWQSKSLAEDRVVPLFDRATGWVGHAADLPLPSAAA